MTHKDYLQAHLTAHPSATPQDLVKLCYQAACGAEHLLRDMSGAERYFQKEFSDTAPASAPIEEPISDEISRVNLAAWKAAGLPPAWLFRLFADSASDAPCEDGKAALIHLLEETDELIGQLPCRFSAEEWKAFLQKYRDAGMPSLHHSDAYRQAEKPAYRIVRRRALRILPVLMRLPALTKAGRPVILALDGRAASGKTTAADLLCTVTGASVIRMDDFFLPPALRTAERFATPGGNVHYERFCEEILPRIALPDAFSYRVFDCSIMDLRGERTVEASSIRLVEGSYSHHPAFGSYADLRIFSDVSPEEQMRRIRLRNGEFLARRFEKEWIPMEEAYFDHYHIRDTADICL